MTHAPAKRTGLIAIAAAGLALAGCSAGPQSVSSADDGGGTVLTMSAWADDQIMDALITRFEADNPGVTIDNTELPWPGITTQINTELVSGTASDIVVVFPGNGSTITAQTLAKGGYLADLSDSPWTDGFSPANKQVMSSDGEVLMASNNFTIIPAIYNSDALAEVGATAPTTFSEVLDLCTTAESAGKVAYALAGLAGGNFHVLPYALTSSLVYGQDPDFVQEQTAGDVTFSDSAWTTAMDEYKQMLDAGCFTQDATGTSLEVAQGQVAKGEALSIVTVSNQIDDIQAMAPEGTAFETAALPATDDPSDTFLPVGLGSGYGVNAKSEHLDLAKKFIDFYMSPEGVQIALDNGSIFPSQETESFEPSATLAGVAEQAQSDKTTPFPDATWPNSIVNQTYTDGLQQFIGGQTTAAALLKAMDDAYTE
jgi:raffinose/stachyose/melibiose transport system substrate-binding protein